MEGVEGATSIGRGRGQRPPGGSPPVRYAGFRRHTLRSKDRWAVEHRDQPRRPAVDENIDAVKLWERAELHKRTRSEAVSEAITRVMSGGFVLAGHLVWFTLWILVNTGAIAAVAPFDPFPFPLLTSIVSLEAIFLSLFVLSSQNRMSRHSEKREQLDLQINLLSEREMTAVLKLLQDIARHLDVKISESPERMRDLEKKTDIHKIVNKLEEMPKP